MILESFTIPMVIPVRQGPEYPWQLNDPADEKVYTEVLCQTCSRFNTIMVPSCLRSQHRAKFCSPPPAYSDNFIFVKYSRNGTYAKQYSIIQLTIHNP